MRHLDQDLKTFIDKEIDSLCDNIDYDPRDNIPRRTEKHIEKFLVDSKGELVVNEKIHVIMHQFRRKVKRNGFNKMLVLGCFGHGKTENMCIGLCLDEIARNPNILIKIVHIGEKEAVNRVRAIKEYIENPESEYKRLNPHIQQTSIWGQEKFIIKRKAISKDPTVQGFGVISSSLGGRANLIIFDDVNDLKSAVLEPTTRENVETMIKTTWMTRLIPDASEAIILMNRWHENDLANYVQNNPMWAWMSVAVNEEKTALIYEDSFKVKKEIPLWTKFGKKDLIDRHITMGDRDYKRGFELKPYSDKDKSFPGFEQCCHYGIKPLDMVGNYKDWVFCAGIDFAGLKRPGTILLIGGMNKITGTKIPIEIIVCQKPSDLANSIVDTWKTYGVEVYLAENNAVQDTLIDMLQSYLDSDVFRRFNIKVEGFNTGKNKADPMTGLPSIQKEFERNEWMFCFERQFTVSDNDDRNVWWRFYQEMKHHPFYKSSDIVMSSWFLREAFKQYQRKGEIQMIY